MTTTLAPSTLIELADALIDSGDFDPEAVRAGQAQADRQLHPISALAAQSLTSRSGKVWDESMLTRWWAGLWQLPFERIDPLQLDVQAITAVMSIGFAQSHGILAVAVTPDRVRVAVSNPSDTRWVMGLEQVSKRQVERVIAPPADILRHRHECYSLSQSIGHAQKRGDAQRLTDLEQLLDLGSARPDADDQSIVQVVDWVLRYAFEQRASDIHIEPRRDQARVRLRIDGVLHTVTQVPAQIGAATVSRFKALGRLDVAEKRQPQDGRLKTRSPQGREVELRLSTLPTAFGEKLVARIFDPDVLLKDFPDLGLDHADLACWQRMTGQREGIVLVTGPTGSGKTTTLYSTLRHLATDEVNVCTIEDPIELIEPAFNQVQAQHNIGLDFAAGMKSLLRQDPDIIMVGEIRDRETADMAVQAALTGHLVVSTLHTNDAPSAITRLLELGVPAYLLRATLLGVMAQRLGRTLCPHCKRESTTDAAVWDEFIAPFKSAAPASVFEPVGCEKCRDTGFLGRQGIYEVLELDDELRALIQPDMDLAALKKRAWANGSQPLRLAGAARVAQGLTTLEEVGTVTPPL
ncbi:type II/IV secretion system protein [Litorivicinus lipolyticus]|uniref:Type II/IV secretion system protein n=1 Tax=Litorivicinus lipolyticus TaxID=418701 RepID=A0A5Q2Q5Z4_9GAMM|nr:GspE/PulE family protein [Litorivicinus lipolyticus]QGG79098.1 type II/IV secretion system protein [Litorivicinus lipolyticus]